MFDVHFSFVYLHVNHTTLLTLQNVSAAAAHLKKSEYKAIYEGV